MRILLIGSNESTETYKNAILALSDKFECTCLDSVEELCQLYAEGTVQPLDSLLTTLITSPVSADLYLAVLRLGARNLQSADAMIGRNLMKHLKKVNLPRDMLNTKMVGHIPQSILEAYTAEPIVLSRKDSKWMSSFGVEMADAIAKEMQVYSMRFGTVYTALNEFFIVPVVPPSLVTLQLIKDILKETEEWKCQKL